MIKFLKTLVSAIQEARRAKIDYELTKKYHVK
jgi:hypothetical protein